MTGTIKKLVPEKGFGFIRGGSSEYFFHRSDLRGASFDQLIEGQRVEFTEGAGEKGPRAADVRLLDMA